ncbi:ethanolamine utilization protein EutQ [Clostridium baratii]|uniref:cupin domain-containing protein n=1 Tax=Clostridium baratii TaxID=1561 RepID=UPI0009A38020|nr:cupin domain-containing protein [Clostridium baratii]OPF51052.1 ethanolamine utilization protein EutQ [Clostridium baratii]OPF53965.1 ethanolamine utilization protein EutQ [Clostridium baratii]OPF57957.1 ethanolamine utilization protein EutQ [Clostridium baratii]OPF61446.1 ethanolamine utilization protein EutQ [Clostridium baratii]
MKKLICAKDMEEFLDTGEKVFYIDKDIILTPSAKDIAKNNGISITTEEISEKEICSKSAKCLESIETKSLDSMKLLEMFKQIVNEGLLQEMLKILATGESSKFVSSIDESGLKVVRGSSVKMDVFDTGNPNNKVFFQELISKDESKMSAGFLIIEDSKFEWELTYEEIDYVIEGTVTVEINGKTYEANAGDVLFVPKGSKVVWGSPNKAKLFYATYPANWADLL